MKFGTIYAEPHYNSIKPKIIAEEYLKNDNANSTSLVDYKVFCLEGKPYSILVCADRVLYKGCCLAWYDLEWNPKPDMLSGGHKQDCVTIENLHVCLICYKLLKFCQKAIIKSGLIFILQMANCILVK